MQGKQASYLRMETSLRSNSPLSGSSRFIRPSFSSFFFIAKRVCLMALHVQCLPLPLLLISSKILRRLVDMSWHLAANVHKRSSAVWRSKSDDNSSVPRFASKPARSPAWMIRHHACPIRAVEHREAWCSPREGRQRQALSPHALRVRLLQTAGSWRLERRSECRSRRAV